MLFSKGWDMNTYRHADRVILISCFLLCCLLGAHTGGIVRAAPTTRVAAEPPYILNSGSTNTCPYRLNVEETGHVAFMICGRSYNQEIPLSLAAQFFSDLKVAEPLDSLPFVRCEKSKSFGSTTTITYAGKQSPDLSCPNLNVYVFHLDDDIETIKLALHVCLAKYSTCV
jgi:hypothetical protein